MTETTHANNNYYPDSLPLSETAKRQLHSNMPGIAQICCKIRLTSKDALEDYDGAMRTLVPFRPMESRISL